MLGQLPALLLRFLVWHLCLSLTAFLDPLKVAGKARHGSEITRFISSPEQQSSQLEESFQCSLGCSRSCAGVCCCSVPRLRCLPVTAPSAACNHHCCSLGDPLPLPSCCDSASFPPQGFLEWFVKCLVLSTKIFMPSLKTHLFFFLESLMVCPAEEITFFFLSVFFPLLLTNKNWTLLFF